FHDIDHAAVRRRAQQRKHVTGFAHGFLPRSDAIPAKQLIRYTLAGLTATNLARCSCHPTLTRAAILRSGLDFAAHAPDFVSRRSTPYGRSKENDHRRGRSRALFGDGL